MKRKISVLLVLSMMVSMLSIFSINAYADPVDQAADPAVEQAAPAYSLEGFALADENDNLAFYINDANGFFALQNKKTGVVWYSNPLDWEQDTIAKEGNYNELSSQLVVTYRNASFDEITIYSSVDADIVSEHNGKEQIFTYIFNGESRNFEIPVSYKLENDYLNVEVKVKDIEENSDSRVTNITLLPMFGAGGLNDEGYALLPDGSGSLMEFNKTYQNLDRYIGYVYERDLTSSASESSYYDLTERIALPVFGIKKNDSAFVSVISTGAGSSSIRSFVSRMYSSYNTVCAQMIVRDTQSRKNAADMAGQGVYYSEDTPDSFTVRYYPLDAGKDSYIGMAEKYREYLIKEQGLTKLDNSSTIANSLNLNILSAVKVPKHFLGVPYMGVEALTTFDEVGTIIDDYKSKSVDKLAITLTGWESGGMDSSVSTSFDPDSKVGGKKGAQKLIEKATSENVILMFDANVQKFYGSSKDVKKFTHTAFDLAKTPVTIFPFSLSSYSSTVSDDFYQLIHPTYMVEFADKFTDDAIKNNIKNMSFMNAGLNPYAAYNDEDIVTRDRSADKMSTLFENVNNKTDGIVSTQGGNAYVLGNVSNIIQAPVYSSDLMIAQTTVPFYQIVLRGYVNLVSDPFNLSSEPTELELKCAETGMSPYFELMKAESTSFYNTSYSNYYACNFDDYFEISVDTYNRLKVIYDAVGTSTITNHEIISEFVRITTYENGAKVYVNYGENETTVNGVKIGARSYVVVGGAN